MKEVPEVLKLRVAYYFHGYSVNWISAYKVPLHLQGFNQFMNYQGDLLSFSLSLVKGPSPCYIAALDFEGYL